VGSNLARSVDRAEQWLDSPIRSRRWCNMRIRHPLAVTWHHLIGASACVYVSSLSPEILSRRSGTGSLYIETDGSTVWDSSGDSGAYQAFARPTRTER